MEISQFQKFSELLPTIFLFSTLFHPALGRVAISYSVLPITESLTFIAAETTLQFNDSCKWGDELKQRNGFRKIQNLTMGSDEEQAILHESIKQTEQNNVFFCGDIRMLVCSKETSRCVCGQTQAAVVQADAYKPSAYITEQDGNGETVCRWGEGTHCIPPGNMYNEGLNFYNVQLPPLQCAYGLECLSSKDGEKCSNETVKGYFEAKFGQENKPVTNGLLWEELLSGKICTCGKSKST